MPSWLFGSYAEVQRKATSEGRRCANAYRREGRFPAAHELLEVPPGAVVIGRGVVDFARDEPAWRLFMVGSALEGLWKAMDLKDIDHLSDLYEASVLPTPWGALYYAISHPAPMGAARVALRLDGVLRCWESLEQARYLFSSPSSLLTLEELMMDACDWTLSAWCPEERGPLRTRLPMAATRMASATRNDSMEAILRQVPRTLSFARGLQHPGLLASPALWRERLTGLDKGDFERMSAAWPSALLKCLYAWDKDLQLQ